RRRQGHPLAVERKGSLVLDAPNGPFTLSAKADRIDLATDGHAAIIDYKTGNPPTADQVAAGFNHQLHVQSAILERGGFEGLPPTQATTGAYIGLTGAKSGGKEYRHETLGEETASHLARLSELIAAYDQGAPFYARGRPLRTDDEGDYDHLARRREWEGIEE
ncbi:MAG: PD-(D/E)XK nuclease family protein, partial [Pseudomonadota bacterium]